MARQPRSVHLPVAGSTGAMGATVRVPFSQLARLRALGGAMRIGLFVTPGESEELSSVIGRIVDAEARGFPSAWILNVRGLDALTILALAGRETSNIELGTFVVPTYP